MAAFTLAGSPTFSGGKVTIDSTGSDLVTGPVALVSATQFAVAMRCRFRWAGDGAAANQHRLLSYRDGDPDGVEVYYYGPYGAMCCGAVVSAGPTQSEAQKAYTAAAETDHTIVAYVSAGSLGISVDGSTFTTIARAGGIPAIAGTEFSIGRYSPSAIQYLDGDIYWMVLLSNIPTSAEALTFHNFGNTDPSWSAIPGTPTMLWTCDDANYLTADPGTAGTLTDSSGNGNTAVINGSVPITTGLFEKSTGARNFAAANTNNYLTVVDSATLDLGDVFSLEAWMKLSTFATNTEERVVLAKGTGAYQLAVIPDGRIVARKQGTGTFVVSQNAIALNTPYHVVATKNGNDARLYVNGVDVTGTVTAGITCVDTASSLYIGRNDTATGPFHGAIDDVVLYASVLAPERVLAHYTAANPGGTVPDHDPVIPLSIPGAMGTMRVSYDPSLQPVGQGDLSTSNSSGPRNMWESRADSVGLNGTYNAAEDTLYATWSIVSTPIGNALQGTLPVGTNLKRRCDMANGVNNGGFPTTNYSFGNAWNFALGEEIWFCHEFQIPSNFDAIYNNMNVTNSPFFLINQVDQFPVPGSQQPVWSVHSRPGHVQISTQAGQVSYPSGSPVYQTIYNHQPDIIPPSRYALEPAWHQIVVRWKIAVDNTGIRQCWHRKRGETTWMKTIEILNEPTILWDPTGPSTAPLSGRDFIDCYTRGGTVGGAGIRHRKYARASGPGVLEQFLNS